MFLKAIPLLSAMLVLGLSGAAPAREITDMTGRTVTVPDQIASVATLGSVPVINSFVFAAGKGALIANDLPPWARQSDRWAWQDVFAPQLAKSPRVEDAERNLALEELLTLDPDVALTFAKDTADLLGQHGIPTVVLRIQTPEDVKAGVALVGDLLGNARIGADYAAWFDGTLAKVAAKVDGVAKRPKVLYLNPVNMTQPHLVAEWWIKAAGGDSVTDDGRSEETSALTTEVVLAADPDIIIVGDPSHVARLNEDANLSQLRAVRDGRVLVAPMGAHIWANRTVEQPLTVLWAASHFHPELFPETEVIATVRDFYHNFFGTDLDDTQVRAILGGGA
ncbi:MAG: ABC transporter substrate-binding protein [Paracoccus aminovorans]|nr:ABC transporter substrate-binding protein [Paracoccus aminovorans]